MQYSPSCSFVVPTCHCQQCAPEGASTEGLVSVICCGFISGTARIFHQSGKTWIYGTSRLCSARAEGKDCHQCTGLNRASQSRLFNAVSLSEDTTPGGEKKKNHRFVRWISLAVSSLQRSSVRMRSSAAASLLRSCQGHLPVTAGQGLPQPRAAEERITRQIKAQGHCKWHLLFPDAWRQVKISFTHSGCNTERRKERVVMQWWERRFPETISEWNVAVIKMLMNLLLLSL